MNKEANGRAPVERNVRLIRKGVDYSDFEITTDSGEQTITRVVFLADALDCDSIGHAYECISMSGGYIWWKCRRCCSQMKTLDVPFGA